ncbi:hypothetical protein HanIR_Chr05g0249701 [Helianthus annuus]|nr:hypothetical protein HanIR_Chr05g0249701 [Helianthus annuus]
MRRVRYGIIKYKKIGFGSIPVFLLHHWPTKRFALLKYSQGQSIRNLQQEVII